MTEMRRLLTSRGAFACLVLNRTFWSAGERYLDPEGAAVTYIDRHLMQDEEIAVRRRLHWVMFLGPLLLALVSLVAVFAGLYTGHPWIQIAGGGVLAIAAIWAAPILVRYLSTEFAVTNKRLIRKEGALRHSSRELHLSKLESVHVEQSLAGRVLGYGSMIVSGTGGLNHVFERIPHPLRFREAIQRQLEQHQRSAR